MVCIDDLEISFKSTRKAFNVAKKYRSEIYAIFVSFISHSTSRAPQYTRDKLQPRARCTLTPPLT
jgi:pyruvate/2-oxoacid:ferredoxin oxidoreductase alpha subunit